MTKAAIALRSLGNDGPFRDGVEELLNTLGYKSNRKVELGGVEGFESSFANNIDLKTKEPLSEVMKRWKDVQLVFQFSQEEINGSQGKQFDASTMQSFLFLSIDLKPNKPCLRSDLAEATRLVNKIFKMPVIIVFRHRDLITVSVIHRRMNRRDTNRDVLEKVTLIKDINSVNPHRAHLEILANLSFDRMWKSGVRNFSELHVEWEKTLEIQELNKRFYRELLGWFERASKLCKFPNDKSGPRSNQRHVIRLITRLLFIWFLKEMGLVPQELFDEDFVRKLLRNYSSKSSDYYRVVLQNLFFSTLNTEMDKRSFNLNPLDRNSYRHLHLLKDSELFWSTFKTIPFVNGGLFDCLDESGTTGKVDLLVDAFYTESIPPEVLSVPTNLFFEGRDSLFSIFRRFKFTLEESTPLDCEVALDPELLGCVFENLLDTYDPTTGNQDRKETGSYYTPRIVVSYMVRTALLESILTSVKPNSKETDWWRERLEYLLDPLDKFDDANDLFEDNEKQLVITAISEIKVLDPAVGSGAFLMGTLQVLTMVLGRLDPNNSMWKDIQKSKALERMDELLGTNLDQSSRDKALREINASFERYKKPDFGRKLYLIHHGLYGVDIQAIACQIAKLRFFISLVIEQEVDHSKLNSGITPLPNLETKIVAADSLHRIERVPTNVMQFDEWDLAQKQLQSLRQQYFLANNQIKKQQIKELDRHLRLDLSKLLKRLKDERIASENRRISQTMATLPNDSHRKSFFHNEQQKLDDLRTQLDRILLTADRISDWNPYNQNSVANWFDVSYMFGVPEGFDVVIGNPPYIQLQKDGGKLANKYEIETFETFARSGDIYQLFIERGMECLTPNNGVLMYITSDSWLQAKYGQRLRKYLYERHSPFQIVEMGKNCFESATVHTAILAVREGKVDDQQCSGYTIENREDKRGEPPFS